MTATVCLGARTLSYPMGGHLWAYLNWALGFRALGCPVLWLEVVPRAVKPAALAEQLTLLRDRLQPFGLSDSVVLSSEDGAPLPPEYPAAPVHMEAATEADLFVNQQYGLATAIVGRFKRSALLDIDPGLLQIWMREGAFEVAPHDLYFTIGETVAAGTPHIPDTGVKWLYTPPCVALDWWPLMPAVPHGCFSTLTHWYSDEWVVHDSEMYANDKRTAFLEFADLPRHTRQCLELAVYFGEGEHSDRELLLSKNWRISDSREVAGTPQAYQRFIAQAKGEFSCAKPSCLRLHNAWISDRTLCYLAAGRPAVVQYTGRSRFLPDAEGLFRFRSLEEAAQALESASRDYEKHSRAARGLAEEYFDAKETAKALLERALP